MLTKRTFLSVTVLILSLVSVGLGSVINVPSEQPTIQAGIDAAVDGDTVLVADGTYTGDGNRDLEIVGRAILLISESGPEMTIIDCGSIEGENHRAMSINNSVSIEITGFTITDGKDVHVVDGQPQLPGYGGALVCTNSNLVITDCIFHHNYAHGVWKMGTDGPPKYFPGSGGAIGFLNGDLLITNCSFIGNGAPSEPFGPGNIPSRGGAISASISPDDTLRFYHNIFYNNYAINGGAIAISGEGSNIELGCNDFYENGDDGLAGSLTDQANINGNFSADPLFCDTANGDFHISSNSFCAAENNDCGELIGALGVGCVSYAGPVWHVSVDGDDGTGVGSAGNPFATIQHGIDAAGKDDTVLVGPGTYTGDGNRDIDYGGRNLVLMSENGPEETVIDGFDTGTRAFNFVNGENSSAIVQGFSVIRFVTYGAGAYCTNGSSPSFINCIFRGNYGTHLGCDDSGCPDEGVIQIDSEASVQFVNCSFLYNDGKAIGINNSSMVLTECLLSGNQKALTSSNSNVALISCVLTNNTAQGGCSDDPRTCSGGHGGAINAWTTFLQVSNCTFIDNNANPAPEGSRRHSFGGAIYWDGSGPGGGYHMLDISNTIFAYNSADSGSAIYLGNTVPWQVQISCTNIIENNGGDWVGTIAYLENMGGNFTADPLFCDTANGDFHISSNSPCAAENNDCGELIGALDVSCEPPQIIAEPDTVYFVAGINPQNTYPEPQRIAIGTSDNSPIRVDIVTSEFWINLGSEEESGYCSMQDDDSLSYDLTEMPWLFCVGIDSISLVGYDRYYGKVLISSPEASNIDTVVICFTPDSTTGSYGDTLSIGKAIAEQGTDVLVPVTIDGISWDCLGCDDGGEACSEPYILRGSYIFDSTHLILDSTSADWLSLYFHVNGDAPPRDYGIGANMIFQRNCSWWTYRGENYWGGVFDFETLPYVFPGTITVTESTTDCCGLYTGGYTGNTNCDENGNRNLADILRLIDRLYFSKRELCCEANGNVSGDSEGRINIRDVVRLVLSIYLDKFETAACE